MSDALQNRILEISEGHNISAEQMILNLCQLNLPFRNVKFAYQGEGRFLNRGRHRKHDHLCFKKI